MKKDTFNKFVQIKSVISDNLMEIFENDSMNNSESIPIYNFSYFSGESHSFFWKAGQGKIYVFGNLIFGKNTDFSNLESHDIIAFIYENAKTEFFIKKVVSKTLLILEIHNINNLNYEGEYYVGTELPKQKEEIENEEIDFEDKNISTH
mgnify:CR=1 FL=1